MNNIINIFITTSITAIIILLTRKVFKSKLSPNWMLILWVILGVRLLMPILPESNLSVFNILPGAVTIDKGYVSPSFVKPSSMKENRSEGQIVVDPEPDGEGIIAKRDVNAVNSIKDPLDIIIIIWIIGSVILSIYFILIYIGFHLKTLKFSAVDDTKVLSILEDCKRLVGVKRDVIVKWGGSTPILKGILRPQIILPREYSHEDLRAIFLHELMHYRHKDPLWNVLGTSILCLYWYNPLIWFSFAKFREDVEILCDYRVLKIYGDRKNYASVLMKTALKDNIFIVGTTSMQNGEKHILKRIKGIAYFKKPKFIWSSIGSILLIIIIGICLTNPISNKGDKGSDIEATGVLDYEEIYKNRTLYVGDASKVSNLIGSLYYSEYKDRISLKTDKEPYSITIYYKDFPVIDEVNVRLTDRVFKNVAIMFCLVDNVDEIVLTFNEDRISNTIDYKRDVINEMIGEDVRHYAASCKIFKDTFIPMLDEKDWGGDKENDAIDKTVDPEYGSFEDKLCEDYNIETLLKKIMDSPKESSDPISYIVSHQDEYETILKRGDEALDYMLSRF
ncbi:MAG: DUF4825 domain-containing protein, partial [Clostridiales bacterium]|nr:DUF4825 domain-containing protein [Clostridiales bacterium]